ASVHAAILERARAAAFVARPRFEQAHALLPGWPRGEELESFPAEARGNDALDKAIRLGDLVSGAFVNFSVEAEHAAVGTERIAFVRFAERFFQRRGHGRAARVIMFNHNGGGFGEFAYQVQG